MIMPILVEITYEDDTVDNFKYPAQIWRKSNDSAKKVYATEKQSRFKLTQIRNSRY
jgi:hypothetical protein